MPPLGTTTQAAKDKLADDYATFVDRLIKESGTLSKFKALQNFLELDQFTAPGNVKHHIGETDISVIEFPAGKQPLYHLKVDEGELALKIVKGARQLFIVQNISPNVVRILGGHLEVDPAFFLDYIDAVPAESDITKEEEHSRSKLVPTPWYRLQQVHDHLPTLNSVKPDLDHIVFRFVGPREYDKPNNQNAPERMKPDLQKMNVERIAGLQIPIARKTGPAGRQLNNVAMTRHCAAIWFNEPKDSNHPEWTKGIVLLDPPFEVLKGKGSSDYGTRLQSVYRSFVCRPLPFEVTKRDKDTRASYKDSLTHAFQHSSYSLSQLHPLLVAQGVVRIVASEWIATSAYIERDINTLEWRLETTEIGIEVFEKLLEKLFILRRRIGKYQTLIDDQSQGLQHYLPRTWTKDLSVACQEELRGMCDDMNQARVIMARNAARISQTVDLVTSMMQVREGKRSIEQNERLSFLTVIATIAMPFNALAAILGMQTRFGPKGDVGSFGTFWGVGTGLCVIIWMAFWAYRFTKSQLAKNKVKID